MNKEDFIAFLKDNNFYYAMIEMYKLDNEYWHNNFSLDDYCKMYPIYDWFDTGYVVTKHSRTPVFLKEEPIPFDWEEHRKLWRNKYLSKFKELKNKWEDLTKNSINYLKAISYFDKCT